MSLMAMKQGFKKYGAIIIGLIALTFIVSSFVGFGNYVGGGRQQHQQSAEKPIARVGDREITAFEVDQILNQYMPNSSPADRAPMRLMLLDNFKQQQAAVEAAKAAGITVTDADIEKMRDERWKQERQGFIGGLELKENATDRDIDRALARTGAGVTVDSLRERYSESELRTQAYAQKLQDKFKQEARAKATEEAVRNSYKEIQVRHILVKFGEGAIPEDQARTKAQKLLDAIKADPSKFAALAKQSSDDPGSKATGGFYDWAPAGQYVKSFTEAALSVKPGQVYPELVRESNPGYSGFHIVKLEGVRVGKDFPKDFDKEKQKYIDQYADQQAQQMAQQAMMEVMPKVQVEVLDPILKAAQLQQQAQGQEPKQQEATYNAALQELSKVEKGSDTYGTAPLMRARIYEAMKKPTEAIAAYEEALKYRNSLDTRIALARLLKEQKDNAGALKQLAAAEKLVRGEIYQLREIAQMYKALGDQTRAASANEKAKQLEKRQAAMNPPTAPPVAPAPAPAAP